MIKKKDLIVGVTYEGECRNATIAVWNGKEFVYRREKFGQTFNETIKHFEDDPDGKQDIFYPFRAIEATKIKGGKYGKDNV